MMKPFVRNLIRFLIVGSIPILILTIGYIYFDPFKVLKPYQDYSYAHVIPNRDYISTEIFYKNFEKQQYNSFEFVGVCNHQRMIGRYWSLETHLRPIGA